MASSMGPHPPGPRRNGPFLQWQRVCFQLCLGPLSWTWEGARQADGPDAGTAVVAAALGEKSEEPGSIASLLCVGTFLMF